MSIEKIIEEVLKDKDYYERSGGGLTISGGEPMAQFEFTRVLLHAAKARGIHTCLDTSGFASQDKFAALLDAVDLFLYDYKATDAALHKSFTGVSNHAIRRNLHFLYSKRARIMLRFPRALTIRLLISQASPRLPHAIPGWRGLKSCRIMSWAGTRRRESESRRICARCKPPARQ
ncbi:radical SAM protein [candidate division KSB1 bacterium]|nr:MAG: radical SAM protein [candidate division KSB1 bacterium]MBC6950976.1 radical SAM protein [candidate division KSB1 bacterium]MCE7944139.1 radical SAM protein [Chlorobi bacterium CHB1]MDL1877644.1 radical SAM protein [Cytophagia bacterium CHB2]